MNHRTHSPRNPRKPRKTGNPRTSRQQGCGSVTHVRPSRREFLFVGLVGGLGLTLGDYLAAKAHAQATHGETAESPAKSIINIFLPGGLSAQESFDPKPYAPIEYRGPFSTIRTSLPGVHFSQHMRHTARMADKFTLIRTLTHGEAAHERGTHNMFTGYRPSPALQYPSIGSVISHELGANGDLPPYVCIPNQPNPYAGSGYLSARFGPFSVGSDPANRDFRVRDLSLPNDVDHERFARRQRMLDTVDAHFRSMENADALDAMDSFYQQAYGLISSPEAREAFNLAAEPDAIRDEYGRNQAGQRMLLARRLAESGVRFVSLTVGGWDHHENITGGIVGQLQPFDQAFAALIRDLERRGTLDSTLVMLTTEFGRTPRINRDGGRDHWPRVFSVALAGAGIRQGYVHGKSDATLTAVEEDPVTVEDFATTIYNRIGITADKELMAPGGRPIEIVDGGKVVEELLA